MVGPMFNTKLMKTPGIVHVSVWGNTSSENKGAQCPLKSAMGDVLRI